jgi:hypothetical protein
MTLQPGFMPNAYNKFNKKKTGMSETKIRPPEYSIMPNSGGFLL